MPPNHIFTEFTKLCFRVLSIASGQESAIDVLRECLPLCHEVRSTFLYFNASMEIVD
jgi:hypothetical protein